MCMNAHKMCLTIGMILAGTFLLDWLTPLGSQDFLLYIVPIVLTAWLDRPTSAYTVAALATGLVAVGLVVSPPGIQPEVAAMNRSLSAAVFWMTAFLVIRSRIVMRERDAQHLAAIVRSSPDAILSQNLDGAITSWNVAAEQMLGYPALEVVGQPIDRLLFPERQGPQLDMLRRIREGAAVERQETTWRRKDGQPIDVLLSGSPLRDQAGKISGLSIIAHDITALKQAMAQLSEQDARLSLVVSATKTGVWDWDLRTNGMYYSPYWKESLGYAPDELTDSPVEWETRLHPDDRERAFALVRAFLDGEIPTYTLDHRLRHRDGSYRCIRTQALLRRDEQGVPIRMTGSHVDITEQKQAEHALRQSEERFRRYFELGLIGMAMTSLDKHWIEFNDQLCTIFGYSREELRQLTWADLTFPADLEVDVAQFQRVLEGTINAYSIEKRFVHKSGTLIYAVISANAVRREDGSIEYFVALVHDITQWRRTEAWLKQSEITLQTFFDSSPIMMGVVQVLTEDILHLSDNRATAEFFGLAPQDLRGRTARQLGASQAVVELWLSHYRRCAQTGRPVHFEYEHGIQRGTVQEMRALAVTVAFLGIGPDGLARCSYVAEDVTERRRTETLLRQAHGLLERRVLERTGELANATQRARTLAQRLYDVQEAERRRVAQDLHDEIGQALTVLKMNLQQVERERVGPTTGVGLRESIGISDQLLARVRDLALDLRPSLLDDLGLVPALRWYVTRQAERMGWDLEVVLPEEPPALTAPRSIACFRVVQEALTNVARHAVAHRVAVKLTVEAERIRVVVQDDGCGFDLEANRALAYQGRSLGLIGMEERISLVGGTLTVESVVRQGTTVEFSMPVVGSEQEPGEP